MAWDLTQGTTWGSSLASKLRPTGSPNRYASGGASTDSLGNTIGGGTGDAPVGPVYAPEGASTYNPVPGGVTSTSQSLRPANPHAWAGNPSYQPPGFTPGAGMDAGMRAELLGYGMSADSLFSNLYSGLSAYTDAGQEAAMAAQRRVAELQNRLTQNGLSLQGDLSKVDRQKLYTALNADKQNYGTNSAEIQRTKEFLLHMLAAQNEARQEQTTYYDDQKGFIRKALEQALHQSQLDRQEGRETLGFNLRSIRNDSAARGAYMSLGRVQSNEEQQASFDDLIRDLAARDDRSRTDADRNLRDVRSALEKIANAQKQAEIQWRETNAGLDSDKARLDTGYEAGNKNFLSAIHGLNLQDAAREREKAMREQLFRQQLAAAQAQQQAALAQARQQQQQQAFLTAAQAAQQHKANQYAFFNNMTNTQLAQAANEAWQSGNGPLLKIIQEIRGGRAKGWG